MKDSIPTLPRNRVTHSRNQSINHIHSKSTRVEREGNQYRHQEPQPPGSASLSPAKNLRMIHTVLLVPPRRPRIRCGIINWFSMTTITNISICSGYSHLSITNSSTRSPHLHPHSLKASIIRSKTFSSARPCSALLSLIANTDNASFALAPLILSSLRLAYPRLGNRI